MHLIADRLCDKIPNIAHLEVKPIGDGTCEGDQVKIVLVSSAFEGLKPSDRHRMVHLALQEELDAGAIDSLQFLQTLTPDQWQSRLRKGRFAWIEERLAEDIDVECIEIADVSDGHTFVGFLDGSSKSQDPYGIELSLTVVSPSFEGMSLIERQQTVNKALHKELRSGEIHSLPNLRVLTPEQWAATS